MARSTKPQGVVAEICLYGTSQHGAGWIACIADGTPAGKMLGNGELKPGRSMTAAVWLAADELRSVGVTRGIIRIFEPSGLRCAAVDIGKMIPTFGELKWQTAQLFAISVEELLKNAEAHQ